MRFLHTADWHLGRHFHGAGLLEDQAHNLDHLVGIPSNGGPIQDGTRFGVAVISEAQLMQLIEAYAIEPTARAVQPATLEVHVHH